MNKKELIRLPTIYDAGGDLSKKWFIEFYARNPRTGRMERQRKSKGINSHHTLKSRREAAKERKEYWTDKLKAGWMPFKDENIIYEDNLQFQTFIKNYNNKKSKNGTFKYYASRYLDSIESRVASSTISTYRSKLRIFDAWLNGNEMDEADISAITWSIMVKFFEFIIEQRELSKVSVDNYRMLLNAVFEYVRKERKLFPNPCIDLPGTKRINDSAAAPISETDIPIFQEVIFREDPQLWLAICFEYYCYMRPRHEVRFLKIGDINFGLEQIWIRYENAKTDGRFVSIPIPFMKLMRQTYKLHNYPGHYYVIGKGGKPGPDHVSINNLTNRFVRFRERLNMPYEYKLYSWKHTGVIRASRAGVPDREIQAQAGHNSILTTERYMRRMKAQPLPNLMEYIPAI